MTLDFIKSGPSDRYLILLDDDGESSQSLARVLDGVKDDLIARVVMRVNSHDRLLRLLARITQNRDAVNALSPELIEDITAFLFYYMPDEVEP